MKKDAKKPDIKKMVNFAVRCKAEKRDVTVRTYPKVREKVEHLLTTYKGFVVISDTSGIRMTDGNSTITLGTEYSGNVVNYVSHYNSKTNASHAGLSEEIQLYVLELAEKSLEDYYNQFGSELRKSKKVREKMEELLRDIVLKLEEKGLKEEFMNLMRETKQKEKKKEIIVQYVKEANMEEKGEELVEILLINGWIK